MQFFIHTVILVWSGFCLHFGHSEEQSWNLRVSDPSRDGRFLSVPIYYGDWVPISQAKHTIESVASKIKAATSPVRIEIYTNVWFMSFGQSIERPKLVLNVKYLLSLSLRVP